MRHPLTDVYRRGRERLIELGRTLDPATADQICPACPAWSVKDVYAHLAGISHDIMIGNTEGAATAAWADAHVAGRADRSLTEVLDEWADVGPPVSDLMEEAGEAFPPPLFIDQYTHEWDIRAAIGSAAAAEPDLAVIEEYFDAFADGSRSNAEGRGLGRLVLDVGGRPIELGDGPDVGRLQLDLFEFSRLAMGRRSMSQLAALPWPMADIEGHVTALVRFSVNPVDVHDPVDRTPV